ncbi:hypothetical protein [Terrisporobacter glycolicus]|uniref:Lipoprotein n=1 Tax=Terrisporobacter glycolicus ATCC 14880 = DSM 1288 TaxID=1121315 RepID=A0ABZ2EWB5_9FIRM|nr:hypothetical protein [Terrisporobacter glycolicus]
MRYEKYTSKTFILNMIIVFIACQLFDNYLYNSVYNSVLIKIIVIALIIWIVNILKKMLRN